MLLPVLVSAQERKLGAFAHVASETMYTKNLYVSVGARYKEFRIGYFHQNATIPHEGLFVRQGLVTELGLINVDKIAYLSIGARVMTTNEDFVSISPHFTMAFRVKFVEIPISFSTYKGYGTGLVGLRVIF